MTLSFSRSGQTNPYGKCTDRVHTDLPESTKKKLEEFQGAQGISGRAETIRLLLEDSLFGRMERIPTAFSRGESIDFDSAVRAIAALEGLEPEGLYRRVMIEFLYGRLHVERMIAQGESFDQPINRSGIVPIAAPARAGGRL